MRNSSTQSVEDDIVYTDLMELIASFVPEVS